MRIIYLAGITAIVAVATVACSDRPPKSSTDLFTETARSDLADPDSPSTTSRSASANVVDPKDTEVFEQSFITGLTEPTSKQDRKNQLSDRQKLADSVAANPEKSTQTENPEAVTTTTVVEPVAQRDPFAPIPGSVKPIEQVLAETRPQLPAIDPPAPAIRIQDPSPAPPIVVDPTAEAKAIQVTGVVELSDGKYAIVFIPGENTTRYVKEGQMLASQILVKRIEISNSPTVILQQKGIEVRHSVGQLLSQILHQTHQYQHNQYFS
jgi:hypothetical protein